jgi:hypothetical protein
LLPQLLLLLPQLLLLLPQLLLLACCPTAGGAGRSCELGPAVASNLTASSVQLTWSSSTCARHAAHPSAHTMILAKDSSRMISL